MTTVKNVAAGAAMTARHAEATKKELETTRRRKVNSTEEIRRRARNFFENFVSPFGT